MDHGILVLSLKGKIQLLFLGRQDILQWTVLDEQLKEVMKPQCFSYAVEKNEPGFSLLPTPTLV